MSTLFGQLDKFQEQLGDITNDEFQQLLGSGIFPLLKRVVRVKKKFPTKYDLANFLGVESTTPDIMELPGVILPDQFMTLRYRITAGAYSWTDGIIVKKHAALTLPAGPRNLVLVDFNKAMDSSNVKTWADANSYELALLDDLLAVGSHPRYRELQRGFPIAQLGTFIDVDGERVYPCLTEDDGGRRLSVHRNVIRWPTPWRFLLAHKEISLAA